MRKNDTIFYLHTWDVGNQKKSQIRTAKYLESKKDILICKCLRSGIILRIEKSQLV